MAPINRYHRIFSMPSLSHFLTNHITTHAPTLPYLTRRQNPDPNVDIFERKGIEYVKFIIIFFSLCLISLIMMLVIRYIGTPCCVRPCLPWEKRRARKEQEAAEARAAEGHARWEQRREELGIEMMPITRPPPTYERMPDLEAGQGRKESGENPFVENPFDDRNYIERREARRGNPQVIV